MSIVWGSWISNDEIVIYDFAGEGSFDPASFPPGELSSDSNEVSRTGNWESDGVKKGRVMSANDWNGESARRLIIMIGAVEIGNGEIVSFVAKVPMKTSVSST